MLDTIYGGLDFAASDQSCTGTQKVIGIDSGGQVLCADDIDTNTIHHVAGALTYSSNCQTGNVSNVTLGSSLNGIAVAADGTVYASNTRNPEQIWMVTADGEVSVFAEGTPLAAPNGVAIDQDGNIVVVNVGDNAIITYDQDGSVVRIEHSVEGGNDGIVITADGTKYASSVRYGSVSRIRPGQEAEIIASGIPSAASMCYDSTQNQLVIPLNSNYALAFVRLNDLN